jgi:hypothetical protein
MKKDYIPTWYLKTHVYFVLKFCIADIPDSQSAGGGEESVQAKAAGATLHLQAGGPLECRRKSAKSFKDYAASHLVHLSKKSFF